MFLIASNPALKCAESHIMESCLFSIGPPVVLKKYFFQHKRTNPIKIILLTRGIGKGGILLPTIGGSFQPCLTRPGFVQAAGGPAYFCWPPGTIFFPRNQPVPLSPEVSSSICIVTWASTAACRTWADVFPWDTLSEDTCYGSLSHPTTDMVLHLWLLWLWVTERGTSEKSLWS